MSKRKLLTEIQLLKEQEKRRKHKEKRSIKLKKQSKKNKKFHYDPIDLENLPRMPKKDKLEKMLIRFLNEIGIAENKREAFFSLSPKSKWYLIYNQKNLLSAYCNDITVISDPKDFILLLKTNLTTKCLTALRISFRTRELTFIESFIKLEGHVILIEKIQSEFEKNARKRNSILISELVWTISEFMKTEYGYEEILKIENSIEAIVSALSIRQATIIRRIVELLSYILTKNPDSKEIILTIFRKESEQLGKIRLSSIFLVFRTRFYNLPLMARCLKLINTFLDLEDLEERIQFRSELESQNIFQIVNDFPRGFNKELDDEIEIFEERTHEEMEHIQKQIGIYGLVNLENPELTMRSIVNKVERNINKKHVTKVFQLLIYLLYCTRYSQEKVFAELNLFLKNAYEISKSGMELSFNKLIIFGEDKIFFDNKVTTGKKAEVDSKYNENKVQHLEELLEPTHSKLLKQVGDLEKTLLKELMELQNKKYLIRDKIDYEETIFNQKIRKLQNEERLRDEFLSKTVNTVSADIVNQEQEMKDNIIQKLNDQYQKEYEKDIEQELTSINQLLEKATSEFKIVEKDKKEKIEKLTEAYDKINITFEQLKEEKKVITLPIDRELTVEKVQELKKKREEEEIKRKEEEKMEKEKGKGKGNEKEKENNSSIPPPPNMGGGGGIPPPPNMGGGGGGMPPPPNFGKGGGGGMPPPPNFGKGGGGGLPPPPNFGKGGGGLNLGSEGKKNVKAKVPLKALHWQKIKDTQSKETLWKDLDDEKVEIDIDDFLEKFQVKKRVIGKKNNTDSTKPETVSVKKEVIRLVDPKKFSNLELILPSFRLTYEEIKNAIFSLDERILSEQRIRTLEKYLPDNNEINQLNSFDGDKELLGDCEKFYLELIKIPRLQQRIKLFIFKLSFKEIVTDLQPSLKTLLHATQQIKTNKDFKKFLQFVLKFGNYLNGGTNRGGISGFKLRTLVKLKDTKSSKVSQISFLHYICMYLDNKEPKIFDFLEKFAVVTKASNLSLSQLQIQVNDIAKGIDNLENELPFHQMPVTDKDKFKKLMTDFHREAKNTLEIISKMNEKIDPNFKECASLFGENPQSSKPEEFFGLISSFIADINNARKDNTKRKLDEERKKRQANNPKRKSFRGKAMIRGRGQGQNENMKRGRGRGRGRGRSMGFKMPSVNQRGRGIGGLMFNPNEIKGGLKKVHTQHRKTVETEHLQKIDFRSHLKKSNKNLTKVGENQNVNKNNNPKKTSSSKEDIIKRTQRLSGRFNPPIIAGDMKINLKKTNTNVVKTNNSNNTNQNKFIRPQLKKNNSNTKRGNIPKVDESKGPIDFRSHLRKSGRFKPLETKKQDQNDNNFDFRSVLSKRNINEKKLSPPKDKDNNQDYVVDFRKNLRKVRKTDQK
ncbi:protein diaphanous [Anaeramoeba flamelloides]|uniref:Protein diaphanous n=1 Tax=Anaeramoeba flamelloides TaxID=1746091 RepID=A0ABQ8XWB0_9EUKA|nr:protein diaphanous [Anaeramoeba flamelloides]